MSINHKTCLVCQSKSIKSILSCTDHFVSGKEFELFQCTSCDFVFTQAIPIPEDMGPYYKSEEYISHSDTQKGLVNKLYHSVRNIMLGRKYRLIKRLSSGNKLLDIGCGTGYFPYFMKTKGFDASGMELDADARKFAAENFNLSVEEPDVLLSKDKSGNYDVITLWHVLEHLHDAKKYLKWIFNSLKKDGVLIIALPNMDSFDAGHFKHHWAAYDVPRHLWHFTPKSLKTYLSQFGFELKQVKRLPFDAYYNSLLSAKYRNNKRALMVGFVIGFISNFLSFFNAKKASSVIYVLKKN